MLVNFKLNGFDVTYDVKPGEFLAEALRRNGVKSVHIGCNESSCGACSVLFDGKPILSCGLLAVKAEGHEITTVEGIQDEAAEIAKYFANEGADQCCFCNSALALLIHALKNECKNPSDDDIKKYIVGNLCRCTGYQSQFKAIKRYLKEQTK